MDSLSFEKLVFSRQTVKDFDGTEVPREHLETLVRWATRAPNHRLNEPWRFRILQKTGVFSWISHLRQNLTKEDLLPLEKVLSKLEKVGAVIYCTTQREANALVEDENYAASCAAVEHILLGARCLDYHTYWSSNRAMIHDQSLQFLSIDKNKEKFVGAVWIGRATQTPALSSRKEIKELIVWI